jgi:hypothetical protein
MKRFPWLTTSIPLVLTTVVLLTLSLTNAATLPASPYLQLVPLVGQQPPSLRDLMLRDADLSANYRGYTVFREGAVTNEVAAAAYVDPSAALAQFAAQGRLEGYELVGTKNVFPGDYITSVTRFATTGGAAAGLDMMIDGPLVVRDTLCYPPWIPKSAAELYGGEQARTRVLDCGTPRAPYGYTFIAVRRGTYVVTIQFSASSDEVLKAFITPAVAKLP